MWGIRAWRWHLLRGRPRGRPLPLGSFSPWLRALPMLHRWLHRRLRPSHRHVFLCLQRLNGFNVFSSSRPVAPRQSPVRRSAPWRTHSTGSTPHCPCLRANGCVPMRCGWCAKRQVPSTTPRLTCDASAGLEAMAPGAAPAALRLKIGACERMINPAPLSSISWLSQNRNRTCAATGTSGCASGC